MRRLKKQYKYYDGSKHLDELLTVLDPGGYGAETSSLITHTTALAFQLLPDRSVRNKPASESQIIELEDVGGRYAELTIDAPRWLVQPYSHKGVSPHGKISIRLQVVLSHIPLRTPANEFVYIADKAGHHFQIPVHLQASMWRKLWWRFGRRWLVE